MDAQRTRREPVRIDQAFADLGRCADADRPAMTIVTPFYNMGEFIGETADSVFRQTFRDLEWLIINDGSTEPGAQRVLDELARRDSRVRILHQANAGPAAARNHGFREARAEFIAQLDADDLLTPTFLEKCLWFLEAHPHYAWAHTATVAFGDQHYLWRREFNREELIKENALVSTSVVRKSAHVTAGGYDESICYGHEDWDYWLRMVQRGFTSRVIPEYLCWHRRRPNSRVLDTERDPARRKQFAESVDRKYGQLYKDGLPPTPEPPWPPAYPLINDHLPFVNRYPLDDRPGVLFLWPWLTMGGADKFNLDLLRGLDRSHFRPHVVTTLQSENPWGDRFAELTPEIFHLPNFLPVEDWLRFLVYLIRSRDISIIFISNSEYGYLCSPVLKKIFPHMKVIDFVHMEQMDWRGGGYAYASKSLSPLLDRSLVSSRHLRQVYIQKFSRDPAKVHCVYTDIDAEREFNPERFSTGLLRQEVNCPSSVPVLLYTARVCDQKRPEALIEIASRLRKRTPAPFQVWIVGDGPDLPEMKRLCASRGLEDTCPFWGSRRDTSQFYREADIFLLPSQWEGIALTLYEAMAMGLPVVASDVGGQRELVTPETGILIPPGIPDEIDRFVESLLHLIEHPGIGREMGKAGRARVRQHFPLSRMVEAIGQHLAEVSQEQNGAKGELGYWPLALDRFSQWLEAHRLESTSHRIWQEKLQHEKRVKDLEECSQAQQGESDRLKVPVQETTGPPSRGDRGQVAVLMEVRSLDTGGLEEVVFNLARSLDKARFNVLIVCIERGGHVARKCREHGIPVEVLGEHKKREYGELLDRHSIDLVCAHYSTFGGPLAAEKGIPVVSVLHNLYAWLPNDVFSEMKTNDRYVSKYVAVSDSAARYLTRRFNIASEKVTVIQNGLDVEGLAAGGRKPLVYSRKDFGLGDEDYVFLNVAALTATKGHNALIRAMREIAPEYPRMKVLCVGDTLSQAYSDIVKGRVKEWGLEGHILFSGFVERIIDLYRLADAFVLPSFIEGWSLAAGEAMFFGLPLILTRVGGAEAVVENGDIGRIIESSYDDLADLDHDRISQYCIEEEPSNAGQLVEAMIDFYERRAFWRKAGKKGRGKILKYHTLAMTAKRYEEFFLDEVLRAGRAKEREYLQRLATARTLEHIDQRFTETRSLIETVEGGLQALEARQQALVENLSGTVAQQLAALERAQQQRFASVEYIGRLILDRLSLAKRLKARLRALAGIVARDPARPEQAHPSPFDRPRSLGTSIRALLDRVERALKDCLPYPVRTRIKRALERLPLWSKPASHVAQGPPPVASDAAGDEAYRQHLAEIRRDLAESSGAGAHRLAVQHALDESRFDRIIIYPPTILWNEHLFQRPQQIFRSLAARGALCFYCSANPSLDHVDGIRAIATNLYLCSNPSLLSEPSKHHQTVLWATRPDHRAYLDLFPTARLVYEVIDELEVFPLACNAMEEDHLRLLLEADVVAATAVTLHATVGRIRPDAVLAPNAARIEDFRVEPEAEPPPDLARIVRRGGPIIGYYGALADWFDYDLLAFAAERLPQFSFVLIGPDYDRTTGRLPWGKNVFWLGPKRYDELPRYVQWFDVATIPFKVNRITSATSPIKLFEYMAAEKPIVTTALPECRRYKSVLVAESREGFTAALTEALARRHEPSYRETLRAEATANTWQTRVEAILSALRETEAAPLRRAAFAQPGDPPGGGGAMEQRDGQAWLDATWGSASGPDILCFPINPWAFRFQRTGQLLRRFARGGQRVFHIEIGQPEGAAQSQEASPRVSPLEPNLFQVTLELGQGLNLYQKAFTQDVLDSMFWNLDQLRLREMIGDAICLVAFPGWAPLAERLRGEFGYKIVYDCMDHHRGFGTIAEPILALEEKLIASADLLLVSSMVLYQEHGGRNSTAVLVRNAADFDHFHVQADPGVLKDIRKPIIGYYGAISSWFNVEWIEEAARRRPDWSFVLIGHTFGTDLGELVRLPNVHLLGEQRYESLPGYLAGFDVCCIPFRLNDLTRATDPVKFYEYLCAGKPIVSARLPELAEYADCVYFADDPDEFVDAILKGLAERDDRLASRRIELGRRNTWETRCADVSRAIEAIHPEVSVIIVSFNTLAHTRRCLESLLRYTGYPHYEIIIVDNGSTDGSALFLAGAAWRCPKIRVITNTTNLGFAAAANQGIAAAAGEYVVLLNSDTVVTTGWLAGLLRHLEDREVGLVGAVSNEVANEAKVDDPYGESLEAMRQFAWSYVQAHRGKRFDVPVLAMFCLAMRRDLTDKVGPLDEGFEVGMFEDDDYALRVRQAGFRLVCARDVYVHHHGRASFKALGEEEYQRIFQKNKAYFEAKWQRSWEQHLHAQ